MGLTGDIAAADRMRHYRETERERDALDGGPSTISLGLESDQGATYEYG